MKPLMTLAEVAETEGYFLDTDSGDILRNVGPSAANIGSQQYDALDALPDIVRFAQITNDVTYALETVQEMAAQILGRAPTGRVVNRQTATQPDGTTITEEAAIK